MEGARLTQKVKSTSLSLKSALSLSEVFSSGASSLPEETIPIGILYIYSLVLANQGNRGKDIHLMDKRIITRKVRHFIPEPSMQLPTKLIKNSVNGEQNEQV